MAVNPLIQVLSFTIVLFFMGVTPVNTWIKVEIRTQNGNDRNQDFNDIYPCFTGCLSPSCVTGIIFFTVDILDFWVLP